MNIMNTIMVSIMPKGRLPIGGAACGTGIPSNRGRHLDIMDIIMVFVMYLKHYFI